LFDIIWYIFTTNYLFVDEIKSIISPPAKLTAKTLCNAYLSLSKFRLASLVLASSMVGFIMVPAVPFQLTTFVCSSIGTGLAIASANTFNQVIEVDNDAQMTRTENRPLPTRVISIAHAVAFGVATGIAGTAILCITANGFAAGLAFANIILYAGVYTPLKRIHFINTWVGSIVGAIPPVIGWVAVTNSLDMGALVLGSLLYFWQIPHFLSLSWGLRKDYGQAGYQMLSTSKFADKLPYVSLKYSLYLLPLGALCAWTGITDWMFAVDSLVVDSYLIYYALKFHRDNSSYNARKLFFSTLFFLPAFMALMILHKKRTKTDKDKDKGKLADDKDLIKEGQVVKQV